MSEQLRRGITEVPSGNGSVKQETKILTKITYPANWAKGFQWDIWKKKHLKVVNPLKCFALVSFLSMGIKFPIF